MSTVSGCELSNMKASNDDAVIVKRKLLRKVQGTTKKKKRMNEKLADVDTMKLCNADDGTVLSSSPFPKKKLKKEGTQLVNVSFGEKKFENKKLAKTKKNLKVPNSLDSSTAIISKLAENNTSETDAIEESSKEVLETPVEEISILDKTKTEIRKSLSTGKLIKKSKVLKKNLKAKLCSESKKKKLKKLAITQVNVTSEKSPEINSEMPIEEHFTPSKTKLEKREITKIIMENKPKLAKKGRSVVNKRNPKKKMHNKAENEHIWDEYSMQLGDTPQIIRTVPTLLSTILKTYGIDDEDRK